MVENETDPQPTPKDANALDFLGKTLKLAERFAIDAAGYTDLINNTPRPDKIEIGDFFLTLDGSLVQVIREIRPTPEACPNCGQQHPPANGLLIVTTPDGLQAMPANASTDDEDDDQKTCQADQKDTLNGYVCSIVKGGHGLKHLWGEKPGEKYGVDPTGLAIIPNGDPHGIGVLLTFQIRLVGLSLKKRMRGVFTAEETTAATAPTVQQHIATAGETDNPVPVLGTSATIRRKKTDPDV